MNPYDTPDNFDAELNARVGAALDEFERSWKQTDGRCAIEDFLRETRELETSIRLYWLLASELELLKKAGKYPRLADYQRRFPEHVAIVESVFGDPPSTVVGVFTPRDVADGELTAAPGPALDRAKSDQPPPHQFGAYELFEAIGRGGWGVVFRARHVATDRIVAIKMVRPEHTVTGHPQDRQEALTRFRDEAKALGRLEHDHIVTVYDAGEVDETLYYAMRFVPGEALSNLVRQRPLDVRRAAKYTEQIARALAYSHAREVLHRDMKPSNILLDETLDRALLADFGLAKLLEADNAVSRTEALIGTPHFMSPEQVAGEVATKASDIYGLGATLYNLLTGRPPFQGSATPQILRQVVEAEPVAPHWLNPEVDRDLETICLKCLEKTPTARYSSAEALAEDLRRYLAGEPISARPVGPAKRLAKWARRRPGIAKLLTALAATVVIGFVGVATQYFRAELAQQNADRTYSMLNKTSQDLENAIDFVDYFGVDVATAIADVPQLESVHRMIVEQNLRFNMELGKQDSEEPKRIYEIAQANQRAGRLYVGLANHDDARTAFLKAADLYGKLNERESTTQSRMGLADAWHQLLLLESDV